VKKIVSTALIGLLLHAVSLSAFASGSNKEVEHAQKVQQAIGQLGTGSDARVKLKLRDKTKLEGYIAETSSDSFVVVDAKSSNRTAVPYSQVKQVKGNNLSTGAKIAIGVGVGIGATLLIIWLIYAANER
jgi:hypothetical protein